PTRRSSDLELLELDALGRLLLVLGRAVVAALTFAARHLNNVSHRNPASAMSEVLSAKFSATSAVQCDVRRISNSAPTSHFACVFRTFSYSTISVTVPAPTVRPPSRMAKR